MKRYHVFTSIIAVVIVAAIFSWLHWLVMPYFIAGKLASGEIHVGDYFYAHIRSDGTYDDINKIALVAYGWRAVPEALPAIIPVLIFGCGVAWFLGRWLKDDEHEYNANQTVESKERNLNNLRDSVERELQSAKAMKLYVDKLLPEANRLIEEAKQTERKGEAMQKAAIEQDNNANARVEEAERKLEKERVDNKKTLARMIELKEKLKGKNAPPESS